MACPFGIHVQDELDMLEKFFPNEKKAAENIWKPVFAEYRRLGYRLRPVENDGQIALFEE